MAICGVDVNEQSEKAKVMISLTGQFAAVDDILTGRENLMLTAVSACTSFLCQYSELVYHSQSSYTFYSGINLGGSDRRPESKIS